MSEVERLKVLKEEITKNNKKIDSINNEISKLLLDDKVKKYIKLQQGLANITNKIDNNKKKLIEIEQNICNHKLLFFQSLYYDRLDHQPTFLCLECGKQIIGFIDEEQICVNEDHLIENDQAIFGICMQYGELREKCLDLKEQGLSIENIDKELRKELDNKKNSGSKILNLSLKK